MNPLNIGLSLENAKINKSSLQTRTSLGRMRNPQNWIYASVQEPQLINRGYTGHEMLPEFDLINMNGRCYDPVVGRFLSTDNFVQDPFSSQCYNRYSYCLNNPLKYSDPSGELTWTDVIAGAAVIGGGVLTYFQIGIGPVLVAGGIKHFVNTANELSNNSGMTWNDASNYAGFTVSGNISIGQQPQQNQLPVNSIGSELYNSSMARPNVTSNQSSSTLLGPGYGMSNSSFSTSNIFTYQVASNGGDVIYKEGLYSYSDFYMQFLPADGIGLLGGWSKVKGSANVYRGKDGIYYANVSAVGFAPSSTRGSVMFSGNVEVYSGGNLVCTQTLNKLGGESYTTMGWQNVGQGIIALPKYGSDIYLRFNVGYTYNEGVGYAVPWPAQGHSKLNIPYSVIDAWTY